MCFSSLRPAARCAAFAVVLAVFPAPAFAGEVAAAEAGGEAAVQADAPRAAPELATGPADRPGSVLAALAAVFPGVLLPGAGHFVLGEREAGKNFLVLDAVALVLMGVGFGGQAVSGGADRLSPLTLTPAVAGIALVSVGWLADLLGAAHGTRPWLEPHDPPGSLSLAAGYTGLFGAQLGFHHGLGLDASWRYGSFSAQPWGLFDPSLSYYGAGAKLALVLWRDADDAVTRLTARAAVAHHRFRFDRYSTTVGELHGELRLNLRHLSPTLHNVWMLVRLGAGLEGFAYDAKPFDWADLSPVLVLEVGGGARVHERVVVEFLYRSRKDELPGGIVIPGLFDSYLGMFELSGRVTLTERFAVLAGLRYGNGLMPWISFESQLF